MMYENSYQDKTINKLSIENTILLYYCNRIEYNLNYENNGKYLSKYYKKFNDGILLNDIHLLNENVFKFYLSLNNNYKNDLKVKLNENQYLKDIIIFHKKFIKDKTLIKEINNLMLNNKINNINVFFDRIY